MIKKSTYVISFIMLIVLLGNAAFNSSLKPKFTAPYSSAAPPQGFTGAAGVYCSTSGCHNSFALNSGGGNITAPGLPTSYKPGGVYNFSITIKHGAADRLKWGFSIAARNSAGQPVGSFSTTNPNAAVNGNELSQLNAVGTGAQSSFTYNNLTWTAPTTPGSSDNSITFYYDGVAGDNANSSLSDYVYATTTNACALPDKPGSISGPGTACSGTTKTYSVNPVSGATSYKWTVPAGASIQGPKTGSSIKVVWGSTGGSIKVKAKNSCGFSSAKAKSVTVNCLLAGEENEYENAITKNKLVAGVFPNPTNGKAVLQFTTTTTENYSIRVTDFVGKEVVKLQGTAKKGVNMQDINLAGFEKGIYLVQLQQADGEVYVTKIVLQ